MNITQTNIMPLIRLCTPSIIASQILSVQPMNTIHTRILTSIEPYVINGEPIDYYEVSLNYIYFEFNNDEVYNWVVDTFGGFSTDRWFSRGSTTYLFKNLDDRNWFILRWSS